jgi:hypothetical protein
MKFSENMSGSPFSKGTNALVLAMHIELVVDESNN